MRWRALGVCVVAAVGCGKLDQSHPLAPGRGTGLALGGHTGQGGARPALDAGGQGGLGPSEEGSPPDMGGSAGGTGVGTAGRPAGGAAGASMGGAAGAACVPTGWTGSVPAPEPAPKLDLCATPLALSTAMWVAPFDVGQHYVRCGTRGPEAGWRVTVSPGGRYLAAQTAAGTVRLIDVQGWREIKQLASPVGRLDAVAFSPEGQYLATLSAESGEVTLWNTGNAQAERTWALAPASTIDTTASSLAFSSDGYLLATSLGPSTGVSLTPLALQVIDENAGTGLKVPAIDPENAGPGAGFPFMKFVANDSMLLVEMAYRVGDSNRSTRLSLYSPSCGTEIKLFSGYSELLNGYAVSPDGQLVAFAAQGNGYSGLSVVRAATGEPIAADPKLTGKVLAFSPDGAVVYVQQGDMVSALDPKTLQARGSFALTSGSSFLGVSPRDELVAASSGTTAWWDPATGRTSRSEPYAARALAWSQDGSLEIVTGGPALFQAFRTGDATELCAPAGGGAAIAAMATSPEGAALAYAYADGSIEVDGTGSGSASQRFATNLGRVVQLAVSEDARRVAAWGPSTSATTGSTQSVTIFDAATGTALQELTFPAIEIWGGILSPDGARFATTVVGGSSSGARVWDVDSGALVLDLEPSSDSSYQVVRFNSDGSQLSVTSRNAIQVFQLPDGTLVQSTPSGIYGSSPDGTYQVETATGGFEVIRASDGAQVGIFQASPVSDITFAASNQLVAAAVTVYTHGASFATEEIWDLQTGDRLRLLPAFPPGTAGTFAIPGNGDQVLTLDGTDAEIWCR
jgi:WD40 repeat protein